MLTLVWSALLIGATTVVAAILVLASLAATQRAAVPPRAPAQESDPRHLRQVIQGDGP